MEYPKCGKAVTAIAPTATCPWCRLLVSNPDAGVVATPGRRLGACILEVVVGAVLAGIVFSSG